MWGSKIETVSRKTLTVAVRQGGLGLIDFICKSKALKISLVTSIVADPKTKDFYLVKYFVGSQLARLREGWSHLRDNSSPRALVPTDFYDLVLRSMVALSNQVRIPSQFSYNSKDCYREFLKETVSAPVLPHRWSPTLGPGFQLSDHWSLVREPLCENSKNDLAWMITLRGVKVRDSLRTWGYTDSEACAHCGRAETIDHCFLHCRRARGVWKNLSPVLSALLGMNFVPNVPTVFFYQGLATGDKNNMIARYLIKSALSGIWFFRNKATFHNGTEDARAITRFIRHDIVTRLNVDFFRMTEAKFASIWCHPHVCKIMNGSLQVSTIL